MLASRSESSFSTVQAPVTPVKQPPVPALENTAEQLEFKRLAHNFESGSVEEAIVMVSAPFYAYFDIN